MIEGPWECLEALDCLIVKDPPPSGLRLPHDYFPPIFYTFFLITFCTDFFLSWARLGFQNMTQSKAAKMNL